VSGVLKNDVRRDAGGAHLQHLLLQHEVLAPELLDVGADSAANWSEVVKSRTSSVYLEPLKEDVTPLDQIVQQFSVLLHQLCVI
jgi:hypothetical protein